MHDSLVYFAVAASLLMLWKTSIFMVDSKKIVRFFPFFNIGLIYLFYIILIICDCFFDYKRVVLDFFIAINLFWILMKFFGGRK